MLVAPLCREGDISAKNQKHRRRCSAVLSSPRSASFMEVTVSRRFASGPALAAIALTATFALPAPVIAQANTQRPATAAPAPPMTRTQVSTQLDANFNGLDTNKDKSLSKSEIDAAHARTVAEAKATLDKRIETEFARLDTNKDNQLSVTEFRAAAGNPRVQSSEDLLKQLDRNGDGKVAQDEYRATPLANFDRIDANKDGTISAAERTAAQSARRQ